MIFTHIIHYTYTMYCAHISVRVRGQCPGGPGLENHERSFVVAAAGPFGLAASPVSCA